MKTHNLLYTKFSQIESYVNENKLSLATNILVQVFTTIDNYAFISTIRDQLIALLPKSKIMGMTTSKVFYNGKTISHGTVISITEFEKTSLDTYVRVYDNANSYELGQNLANHLITENTQLIIAFVKDENIDGLKFIEGFNSESKNIILSGGLTYNSNNDYIFTNDQINRNGIISVALNSDSLTVYSDNSFGWTTFGHEHTVTKSHNNIIQEIDSIPAKKIYKNYVGDIKQNSLGCIGTNFPVVIQRNNEYIACPIIDYTDNDGIKTFTHIHENQKINLSLMNLKENIKQFKEIYDHMKSLEFESLFIYSNLGLAPLIQPYNTYVDEKCGGITGCYTNGEFSFINNKNSLRIGNISIIGLNEGGNETESYSIDELISFIPDHEQVLIHTSFDIIKNTSNKLSTINKTLENAINKKNNELIKQYYLDKLTSLPNLNTFNEILTNMSHIKLALIDISSFININNFYGTSIGDQVLVEFASMIKIYNDEKNYYTYRIYSDIFAVVSYNPEPFKEFISDMEKLHSLIDGHCFLKQDHRIFITTTISISNSYNNAFRHASMAKEYAKSNRIPFIVYSDELKLEDEVENNLIWSGKIRKAIAEDKVIPYFQPIYDNKTGEIYKFEVLMRIIDDDSSVITPYFFLEIAKRTNLYKQLTKIMIDHAFKEFKDTDFDFSINLCVEDITDKETCQYIFNKLRNSPNSEHVIFEIVESEGINNFSDVVHFINTIKSYGARFAIDDFGSGFSNFNYLFKLNIDCIKIDGSIIQNIIHDRAAQLVTETIINFAKKMGISTIAEFVSNKDIYDKIKNLGIDYSQGYYFAKPVDSLASFL